jgi:hypothetical protein
VIDRFVSYSRRDREAAGPSAPALRCADPNSVPALAPLPVVPTGGESGISPRRVGQFPRGAVAVRVEAATVIPLSGRWRRR